jgi:hypothetical protein
MGTGFKGTRNTNGRPKGTPNRTTAETKELLQKIVSKELDKIGNLLDKLDPLERVNAIIKLLPYIVPKQSEVKSEIMNIEIEQEQILDLSLLSMETLEELSNAYVDNPKFKKIN